MEPQKPPLKDKILAYLLVFAIAAASIGFTSYAIYNKYILSPRKEQQKEKAEIAYYLKTSLEKFTTDTLNNKERATKVALDIIAFFPMSKEATICKQWMLNNNIDYKQEKEKQEKEDEKSLAEMHARISRKVSEHISQPAGDELHGKAWIIAQNFVEHALKSPTSAPL